MAVLRRANFSRRGFDPRQVPSVPVELDRAHPLANGLVGCWIGGRYDDLTGNSPAMVRQSAAGAGPSYRGTAWSNNATNSAVYSTAGAALKVTTGSMVWTGDILTTAPADYSPLFCVVPDGSGSAPYTSYWLGVAVTATVYVPGPNFLACDGPISGPLVTGPQSIACVFAGANTTLAKNGTNVYTGTSGNGIPAFTSTSMVAIGGYPTTYPRNPTALTASAMIYNRQLGDELTWISIEPFAMLRPIQRRRFYLPNTAVAAPAGKRPRITMIA
jgi:hypothetical protein